MRVKTKRKTPRRWLNRLLRGGGKEKKAERRRFVLLGSGGIIVISSGIFLLHRHFFLEPPTLEEKFVIAEGDLAIITPTSASTRSDLAEATPTYISDEIQLVQPGRKALLPGTKVSYQTFNNCGPANLSMILSYYGISKSQKELGELLRPHQHPKGDNDDKTVFPQEFIVAVEGFGLKALYRPNGSLQLMKQFLTNGVPVVVKTLLKKTEDSAHFRVVRGFDEDKQVLIVDDSYFGPNRKISYFDFLSMWQPFNYLYIPVYRGEKQMVVEAIVGEEIDEEVAYWRAINRAQKEIEKDPENVWPKFNLVNSYYHVSQFEKCVEEFEKIESTLPRRALWYQIEPILAYQQLGEYDRVFEIIEKVLADGNRAFSELYQTRGEIYLKRGEKEVARKEFEKALKYNQNFLLAREALRNL